MVRGRQEMRFELAQTSGGYPVDAAIAVEVLSYACIPYFLYFQLKKRVVKLRLQRSLVLIGLGSLYLAYYAKRHPISERDALLLIASIVSLGIGLGVVRAYTIRLWNQDSVFYRQGTKLTALLWIVAVGLHLSADHLADTGSASLLLYLGVTISTQRMAIRRRVAQMQQEPPHQRIANGGETDAGR
jgi:hypothetical protein